jgi:hypothetical protein
MAATRPSSRRARGPGIAKVQHVGGLDERPPTPTPRTRQMPYRRRGRSWRPCCAQGGGGAQHVLALEQAGDPGLARRRARRTSASGGRSTCRRGPGRGLATGPRGGR